MDGWWMNGWVDGWMDEGGESVAPRLETAQACCQAEDKEALTAKAND